MIGAWRRVAVVGLASVLGLAEAGLGQAPAPVADLERTSRRLAEALRDLGDDLASEAGRVASGASLERDARALQRAEGRLVGRPPGGRRPRPGPPVVCGHRRRLAPAPLAARPGRAGQPEHRRGGPADRAARRPDPPGGRPGRPPGQRRRHRHAAGTDPGRVPRPPAGPGRRGGRDPAAGLGPGRSRQGAGLGRPGGARRRGGGRPGHPGLRPARPERRRVFRGPERPEGRPAAGLRRRPVRDDRPPGRGNRTRGSTRPRTRPGSGRAGRRSSPSTTGSGTC